MTVDEVGDPGWWRAPARGGRRRRRGASAVRGGLPSRGCIFDTGTAYSFTVFLWEFERKQNTLCFNLLICD